MLVMTTEYLWLQPDPSVQVMSPTGDWGKFTSPTGAPETSLRDETTLNVTWETQAQFVNLTYQSEVNAPNPIFGRKSLDNSLLPFGIVSILTFAQRD